MSFIFMNLAPMSFLKKITDTGIDSDFTIQKKRSIVLSNYMALVLSAASILLFLIVPQNHNLGAFKEMLFEIFIFSLPILLNHFRATTFSRLYLCWLPPVLLMLYMTSAMINAQVVYVSSYDGLRFYLLAMSCIPYLLIDSSRVGFLIAGILPGLICLVFCDPILELIGVGYELKGVHDPGYSFTPLRALVSYLIVSGSCISLNFIITKSDQVNQELLNELTEKNKLIREQSKNEVLQLNQQLRVNLDQLSEREFILNQSQRIAKVGSWEYRTEDQSVFWTDEMYNIFGLDKAFRLEPENFLDFIWEDQRPLVVSATQELLKEGTPYDLTVCIKTPLVNKKWIRIYAYPIQQADAIIGVGGICHDVTFYKEAEELTRASEMKYRSLFEQASDPIMITDFKGRFIDVNAALCNLFGYTKNELAHLNISKLIDPGQLKEDPIRFEVLARGEQVFNERRMIHKDGTVIEVEANVKMFGEGQLMAIARDVTQRKRIEHEKERARYLLNERIKELTTLYRVGRILNDKQAPTNQMLEDVVFILPFGWQYPEITAARIYLDGQEYKTPNYAEAHSRQQAEIRTSTGQKGILEVIYLEARPEETEGPFLKEERDLINMVAEMVQIYLARKEESEELSRSQANLSATINNTTIMIWSVDMDYNLIMFNKPFYNYIKETYQIEIQQGSRIFASSQHPERQEMHNKWEQIYLRALAGEIVSLEESRKGRDFYYSLSPIIENNQVIGVSVFAENVTDRKNRDRELAETTRELGEMKLMALRSVMSPHFIFNVLNSIQFFIAKNDRLNAINYLSTFSKLIRSVLTQSVNNKIKLADEIEMLKNYTQLEMTRFENKFDFILKVDPELDPESVEIPSLLIQPYVENAILHGLYNKAEHGTLTISICEKNDTLIFVIEDDGIGRKAAMQLRQQNFPLHKSMGIRLTEERLKLINQHHQTTFEIEDLERESIPSGTRVTIRIKL
jgi:PAS domain S-box-containing protein